MTSASRAQAVRELLHATARLATQWTAEPTQRSIADSIGLHIAPGDVRALYVVGLRGGAIRPAVLAAEVGLSRPTVSKVIARLEAAGLVSRVRKREASGAGGGAGGGDGRAVELRFTRRGAAAYSGLLGAGARLVDQAMGGMTPAEIDAITAATARITMQLRT